MIHVTITDLETNEVKLDKDVNAVIVGMSSEGDVAAGVVGSVSELAFAYGALREAIHELADDNPEFWPICDFIRAMQDIENDNDADE